MTLYKYKSAEHIEDVIVNKRLFCSRFDTLNDPMEWAFTSEFGKEKVDELINEIEKDKWRICCLSKSKQYGLMWSMYGDEHRGVCIEVEVNKDNLVGWKYRDIKYENNAPSLDNLNSEGILNVLYVKSKQWKHEQEVRFFHKLSSYSEESKIFLPVKINCIYLGKRMESNKKDEIKKSCQKHKVNCIDMDTEDAPKINFWNDEENNPFK